MILMRDVRITPIRDIFDMVTDVSEEAYRNFT